MPFKGFNSVLFDFNSVVDKELSLIRWIGKEYKDASLDNFDKHRLLYTSLEDFKFFRVFGYFGEDLFRSLIVNPKYKPKYTNLIDKFYNEKEKEILNKSTAINTSMVDLIKGYKKAADGAVKTTVRCSSDNEANYIKSILDDYTNIVIEERSEINTENYGRIIVGSHKDPLEYNLTLPKSIVVLDFKENMADKDITCVNPELIINLGDMHEVSVIRSYKTINLDDIKG